MKMAVSPLVVPVFVRVSEKVEERLEITEGESYGQIIDICAVDSFVFRQHVE